MAVSDAFSRIGQLRLDALNKAYERKIVITSVEAFRDGVNNHKLPFDCVRRTGNGCIQHFQGLFKLTLVLLHRFLRRFHLRRLLRHEFFNAAQIGLNDVACRHRLDCRKVKHLFLFSFAILRGSRKKPLLLLGLQTIYHIQMLLAGLAMAASKVGLSNTEAGPLSANLNFETDCLFFKRHLLVLSDFVD